ncbi:MAG: ECF transporter S component [Clostridiaceae bacterium]|nr:ECF transporter S component [Clostridiaceae bacterium]
MKINTKTIARTGILLAVTIVLQSLGRIIPLGPYSNFIVGPLVNASLLVSTAATGLIGGAVISIATPFVASFTAGVPILFAPFIAIGNFILVLLFYIFIKKNKIVGIVSGAVLKFAFLTAAINIFVQVVKLAEKQVANMLYAFSWPQLVTAIIGGILALVVLQALGEKIKKTGQETG